MKLATVDISIIIIYLIFLVGLGIYFSRRASKNITSYFLGGRNIPWYILGISNASGMVDITSTIWLVSLAFIYGVKSAFFPWIWPVFNQIFLMIYVAVWLRRSGVLTGAEWMKTRFGEHQGGTLSRLIIVVFALISVIGFIAYAFKGIGKFSVVFLPWDLSENVYAMIIMGITTIYVIAGGMFSVVFTDIVQFLILTIVSIIVGIIAMVRVSPVTLQALVPEGWFNLFSKWRLDMDWSGLISGVNEQIAADGYSLFYVVIMMMLLKGVFVSMAGPAPNYDMQRILAARTPRDAAKISFMSAVVIPIPRYFMVVGITILGLAFLDPQLLSVGEHLDFERILPFVLNNFIPAGLLGLIIVGFLAAFMSTIDSTVNSGAAYIVNDLYKKYFGNQASDKKLVIIGYIASFLIVVIGVTFGFFIDSVDSITKWLFAALVSGYVASNILKWHWWRLNGYGYFAGMLAGIIGALFIPALFPGIQFIYFFPLIFIISFIACIVVSLWTPPEKMTILRKFYKQVRPWGFWKPVLTELKSQNSSIENKNFSRDMINVAVGIVWQFTLTLLPFYIILRAVPQVIAVSVIIVITSIWLKYKWYDKLENH